MNIGIIVHSKTGHSLSAARKLQEKLLCQGHHVTLERLSAINDNEFAVEAIQLRNVPKADAFDVLILGGPVRGGILSPVLQKFLQGVDKSEGKRVYGFVTQFFKPAWGGIQALARFTEISKEKGFQIAGTFTIPWPLFWVRRAALTKMIDTICKDVSK